jgi:hypothetical protein
MGKNLKAAVICSSHRNFGCLSLCIVGQAQDALSQFAPSFYARFLDTDVSFVVYGTTLLKKVNPDYPLAIIKNRAIFFLADGTLWNFLGGDKPGCFHCMLCFFLDSGSK